MERLHFGVFKHHHFNKIDCSKFLACMKALKSFSFRDEERQLIQVGNIYPSQTGDKVLAYSVLKLAIVDSERREAACPGCMREACRRQKEEREARGEAHVEHERFKTTLAEIKVVDRSLKPEYLLEACPDLSGLYLDWQEEQALPPFNRYLPNWFSEMLRSPRWNELCSKLTNLEIVFPSAHTPNSYSLTLGDLGRLLSKAVNLKRLKLVGAGRESPVPLIQILRDCPNLVELHLEKTSIHVPDNYEVIHKQCVNSRVRVFRFLGDMTSLLMNEYLTRGVAHYMPGLRELEVQPESAVRLGHVVPPA